MLAHCIQLLNTMSEEDTQLIAGRLAVYAWLIKAQGVMRHVMIEMVNISHMWWHLPVRQ